MITIIAPTHALASSNGVISLRELGRHVQLAHKEKASTCIHRCPGAWRVQGEARFFAGAIRSGHMPCLDGSARYRLRQSAISWPSTNTSSEACSDCNDATLNLSGLHNVHALTASANPTLSA